MVAISRWFTVAAAALAALVVSKSAHAEEPAAPGQGYCDFVEGVAASESALLWSPEVFGSFGYIDQLGLAAGPDASSSNDLRLTAGLQYRLDGLYEGIITRDRARAACKRFRARQSVQEQEEGAAFRALSARAKVLEEAMPRAEAILAEAERELRRRRTTAQQVTATRFRVDELRDLAADTERELGSLSPAAAEPMPRTAAMREYYEADADLGAQEARLRRARAWDLSVRVGYDRFLEGDDESPYFAVLQVSYNLGGLLQGRAEKRAAAGRKLFVEEELGFEAKAEAMARRMRAAASAQERRLEETGVLVADLEEQLRALKGVGGDSGRRYQEMIWFQWVKVRAEHEYLRAHVDSLREIMGE